MPAGLVIPLLAATLQAAPVPAPSPSPSTSTSTLPAAARTAPAVLERNRLDVEVNADGTFVSTREVVARVDRDEAIRGASTLPIPVSRSLQSFELVEAWTETPDHRRLPVAPASIITQAPPYAAQMQTLSDVELKIVNFPAVTVGSRVHLTVRVRQTTPNFPGAYMLDLAPGHATPVLDGRVRLSVPRAMALHVDADGVEGGRPRGDGDRTVYDWRYAVTDYRLPYPGEIAAIDQTPRLIVTSLDGWPALARAYQDRATGAEAPSPAIRALADRITAGARDDRERVRLLARWVGLNVRYLNIMLGVGGFVPDSADIVFQTRYGDCKGHATILNALLAAKGIASTSVLINAGATFRQPTVAGQVFNHMINYVPSLGLFVDTTDPFALFGDLPVNDRDKFVVLTRDGTATRTPARGPYPDAMVSETSMTVRPDGGIDGTTRIVPSGSYVGGFRRLAIEGRAQDQTRIVADLLRRNGTPGSGTLALPDPEGADGAMAMSGTWHLDDAATADGTGALRVTAPMALESIAAVAASAAGPLPTVTTVCGAVALTERTTVRFPEGTTILSIPPAAKIDTAEISYTADWTRDGRTVNVARSYVSHYPGRSCSPATIAAAQTAKRRISRDIAGQIIYRAGNQAASAASARPEAVPLDGRQPHLES